VHKRLSSILRKLRNAAGPSVPIIGMNYYDPFLGDWVGGGSLQNAAIQSVSTVDTIDSFLGSIYGPVLRQICRRGVGVSNHGPDRRRVLTVGSSTCRREQRLFVARYRLQPGTT
jgi:hypothetical protein